jgi:hypothetical protein
VKTQTLMGLIVAVERVQHQANRRRWKLLSCLTVLQLQIQVKESSVSFMRSVLFANNKCSELLMTTIRYGENYFLTWSLKSHY